jgi:hypothetical protein
MIPANTPTIKSRSSSRVVVFGRKYGMLRHGHSGSLGRYAWPLQNNTFESAENNKTNAGVP